MLNDILKDFEWEFKFMELEKLFLLDWSTFFAVLGVRKTQEGPNWPGTFTGIQVKLTIQPTQQPIFTQQSKTKCNLKNVSLCKQLILWDLHLKFLNCLK